MTTPIDIISLHEFDENLVKFNSFVCILHGKRLNSISIFTLLVQNEGIRQIFKKVCLVDNDRTCFRLYLRYNPKLCRSKVVKNLLRTLVE